MKGVPEQGWRTFDFRLERSNVKEAVRWGHDAHLDGRIVSQRLSRLFPAAAADLMEIAAAVYSIDRLAPRGRRDPYHLGWSRRLRLHLPVRSPDMWQQLRPMLSGLLSWLTDDDWDLHFHPAQRMGLPLDEPQGFLFDTVPRPATVVLFSGGLDSAAGLAGDLATGSQLTPIPVSVSTNPRMASCQRTVLGMLGQLEHACRYRLHLGPGRSAERTQRTRGFLFLAAGIATAWAARLRALRVYENGIGAINLPLIEAQHGSQATRAVHPRTLQLMEQLVTAASGIRFRIELPNLWLTKAELIRRAPIHCDGAFSRSITCDVGFSSRTEGAHPCGACTSCVLRRQAVAASGRRRIDAGLLYRSDLSGSACPLAAYGTFWHVARLRRSLVSGDPWRSLVEEFPQLLDLPSASLQQQRSALLDLYGRYCAEWQAVDAELGVNLDRWRLERRPTG